MPARTRPGHRTITRAFTATLVTLALTATIGCGTEPETNIKHTNDKPDKTEQAAKDTPSPTPSPKLEEEPYVQVALAYYEAFNDANDTGKVDKLRQLSTQDCEACGLTADRLEKIYADGGRIEGGDLERLDDVELQVEGSPDGPMHVSVVYEYQEETVVEKAGDKPKDFPTELTKETFTLELEGGTWKITDLVSEGYKK